MVSLHLLSCCSGSARQPKRTSKPQNLCQPNLVTNLNVHPVLQNVAEGGLAVFALGNLSDPDCVVEGRILLGRRAHYNLDYYAPEHASVLSEWEGSLRVRGIIWLSSKVGPGLQEFYRQVKTKVVSNCRNKIQQTWGQLFLLMQYFTDGFTTTKSGRGCGHPQPKEARKCFGTRKRTADTGCPTQLQGLP